MRWSRKEFILPVALVTGAQQGIGLAIAEALARDGADVALNWLDQAPPTAAIQAHGRRAALIQADVSTAEGRAVLQRDCESALGVPDILVCNAGIFPRADFLALDEMEWDRILDTNLKAVAFQAQLFARSLAGRPGAILTISSSAVRGDPRGVAYAASKAGLLGLTRSLALALAPAIRVNCIAPGLTDTAQPRGANSEAELHTRAAGFPIPRMGQPSDIAEMAAFLCSARAGWITGQVHHVNGGIWMP